MRIRTKADAGIRRAAVADAHLASVSCSNGFMHRCTVDQMTGQISDQRTRLCGSKACKLIKVKAQGQNSVLVLSTRTWLCYSIKNRFHMTPVGQDTFEHAANFASEPCPEGLVTIQSNRVRILALERIGDSVFNQNVTRLKCTPRKFIKHPTHNYLILLETDHRTHTNQDKEEIKRFMPHNNNPNPKTEPWDRAGGGGNLAQCTPHTPHTAQCPLCTLRTLTTA